jgi:glutathione S-transferase
MTTLHGTVLSPFVRKARVGLFEKNIRHEVVSVLPFPPHNQAPEFRAMSPLGKVPAFEDGEAKFSDSSVILAYLERAYPEPSLYPQKPADYARALWLEELADSRFIESIGPIFFQRVVAPNVLQQEPDQAVIDKALNELVPPQLAFFEQQLDGRDTFVAGCYSVADLTVGAMLRTFALAGEQIDAGRYPNLAAFAERTWARPAFKSAFADEDAALAG